MTIIMERASINSQLAIINTVSSYSVVSPLMPQFNLRAACQLTIAIPNSQIPIDERGSKIEMDELADLERQLKDALEVLRLNPNDQIALTLKMELEEIIEVR